MRLVSRRLEVEAKRRRLLSYVDDSNDSNAEFARALVLREICFVVVRYRGVDVFARGRLVGYVDSSRRAHVRDEYSPPDWESVRGMLEASALLASSGIFAEVVK